MLEVEICNVKLKNPTMLAAGIMGSTAASINWAIRSGAGAVVTKSFGLDPNEGYKNPTIVEFDGGILNSIGLSNPGVKVFSNEIKLINRFVPIIASIYGSSAEEFTQLALKVEKLVDLIELNVSCPHAMEGCGASIGQDSLLTSKIIKSVKKNVKCPVIVKLTPNVSNIATIAESSEKAGCDGITLINSVGPGMLIDIETAKPILNNKYGGLSGPAIKPIALRCVYDVYKAVDVPIIGVGGIMDFRDAIEFIYAGANAVQIGTAIMYKGFDIFSNICEGIRKFMIEKEFGSIKEMIGIAHIESG
jgi:dihydroorotate dehydrogenase (NAD+) catalytic subunit